LDDPESQMLLLILCLTVLVAVISVFYTALSNINRSRLKALCIDNSRIANVVSELFTSPVDVLVVLKIWQSIGILLIGIAAGLWGINNFTRSPFLVSGLFLLLAVLIFLFEIISWKVVPAYADSIALRTARYVRFIHRLSYPFVYFFMLIASPFTKKIEETSEAKGTVTEDEIKMMVEEASLQGVLQEEEKEMIHSVFELGETIAREIMVPRLDIVAVELRSPLSTVLDTTLNHGLSRIPVYEESIDRIIGIVHTKDLLGILKDGRMETPLRDIIRPAYFIPGSKKISECLREMQKEKVAMAVVVDEYGGTDGIVTMEDIIEEIVGDITDEYDKEIHPIEKMDDGSYVIDAKTNIEDVNGELDIDIPAEEFETIGGYVYGMTGHIPHAGETINTDGITITVEKVLRQRITKLRIKKCSEYEAENSGGQCAVNPGAVKSD